MVELEIFVVFFFGFIYFYYCYVLLGGWLWGEIISFDYVLVYECVKIRI